MKHFKAELEDLINRHSMENGSDTPDFILAEYLSECLRIFDRTIRSRENWYDDNKNHNISKKIKLDNLDE